MQRKNNRLKDKDLPVILRKANTEDLKKWKVAKERGALRCFRNSGQSCNAPTRMLVEKSMYNDAVERLKKYTEKFEVGDPKKAWDENRFDKSIAPVKDINGLTILDHDEHMRPEATMQSLGSLDPSFAMMGEMAGFDSTIQQRYPEVEAVNHVHTAGNSSGIVDGAAGILLGNKEMGEKYGLKARAKIKGFASTGSEPSIMLTGPGYVSDKLLKNLGMDKSDIDIWELNEAFAVVVLRYMEHMGIDHSDINVNGGAIAMGHPLGATGAMILGTVLDELERSNKSTALATLCVGGGMGTATVIERV